MEMQWETLSEGIIPPGKAAMVGEVLTMMARDIRLEEVIWAYPEGGPGLY